MVSYPVGDGRMQLQHFPEPHGESGDRKFLVPVLDLESDSQQTAQSCRQSDSSRTEDATLVTEKLYNKQKHKWSSEVDNFSKSFLQLQFWKLLLRYCLTFFFFLNSQSPSLDLAINFTKILLAWSWPQMSSLFCRSFYCSGLCDIDADSTLPPKPSGTICYSLL